MNRPVCRPFAAHLKMLLQATALVAVPALVLSPAYAQQVVGGQPPPASDGDSGITLGGTDAEHGSPGPHIAPHVNNIDVTFGGIAYFGDARGGDGGNGGTAFDPCASGFPPFCIPGVAGGNGGNGGPGGSVDLTNNGDLTTTGNFSHGIAADAHGGNGGDGGWAANFGLTDGGSGGNGGDGGQARAVSTANYEIRTSGSNSHGIFVNASGGNGGDGGIGGNAIGGGTGGNGGTGGSGSTAYGENQGYIETTGNFSRGLFVRSAGGLGGDGADGGGLFLPGGGNGGNPTIGGNATGVNSGTIVTRGDFAAGMLVQSIGGGGGDGGDGYGVASMGGAGSDGNDGRTATGTNTGEITTYGLGSVGMFVESVGGGGGDGGGAVGGIVSVGGSGGGGGDGWDVIGNVGGRIVTGADGSGDGAVGVLIQSVGGGGGNGGYAIAVGSPVAVGVGGSGGTGGAGRNVTVNRAAGEGYISTSGASAIGMLVQSVGGGGGNGGFAITGSIGAAVGVGGSGSRGGDAGEVRYNMGNTTVHTNGIDSAGVIVQSIGGGGGNGGFAVSLGIGAAVGVGGSGSAGGVGRLVDATSSGFIETQGDRSAGFIAQSIGGGGGNGGFTVGGSFGPAIGVGGSGDSGGAAGTVDFRTAAGQTQEIITHGADSIGLIVQSVGGGGGNGGFSGNIGVATAVSVGGTGSVGGLAMAATAHFNGRVETWRERSAGIVVQSIGGGGGNGGGALAGSATVSVGIGGQGAAGGEAGTARYTSNNTSVTTHGDDSYGLIVQSIGGGGGNGGFSINIASISVGVGGDGDVGVAGQRVDLDIDTATVVTDGHRSIGVIAQSVGGGGGNGGFVIAGSTGVSVGVGGEGDGGGAGGEVFAAIRAGSIGTSGEYSHAYVAQSLGGGGGNGGWNITGGLGVNVGVGGDGAVGGEGRNVTASNGATLTTNGIFSHGFLAQSVGGGGGSGGFSIAAGIGPAVSIAGGGDGGGAGGEVRATNSGNITTYQYGSTGLFAQSVGGGGGDGGFSFGIGTTAAVSVGGGGGLGGDGRLVDVTNTAASISTFGGFSHGILAQSVGGGGGNGGASNSISAGLAAISVSVGGGGGGGGIGGDVIVRHTGDITVRGGGSKGIFAQSVGGNGGSGGDAFSLSAAANVYPYPAGALSVAVGGGGGAGGNGGTVTVTGNGHIASVANPGVLGDDGQPINPDNSGGIFAQSVGGRGGDGGRSRTYSGSFSPTVSINLGASIGGKGGGGGIGNTVAVNYGLDDASSWIVTTGNNSHGIHAQSIGGGGGNGGDSIAGAGGLGGQVTINATLTVGGWGGAGNIGGTVTVNNAAAIQTGMIDARGQRIGHGSNAIFAQSVGGGGGSGGSASGTTASISNGNNVNVNANVAIGGAGGDGNNGGEVTVDNSGALQTFGDFSNGILAQSIGGGGGAGGSADAQAINMGSSEGTTINANLAIGGGGGDATGDRDGDNVSNSEEWNTYGQMTNSSGMKVTVRNTGDIHTRGYAAAGIIAQSVGGGGGIAGAADAGSEGRYGGQAMVSVGAGIGLAGGDAGNGGEIEVTNDAYILTDGEASNGITASSVGGGGGIGGAASSGQEAEYAIGGAIGGAGGASGVGGLVRVFNLANAEIRTLSNRSIGIFAQSIGGGGGAGGGGESRGSGAELTVNLTVGGFANSGGRGGTVLVENSGVITTGTYDLTTGARTGHGSHGIMAQSIGGGGGYGGAAGTHSEEATYQIAASLSGRGGRGGEGGSVTVNNYSTGRIMTMGDDAHGIFAQSVGGGGGSAGAGNSEAEGGDTTVTVQMGGTGAGGAHGGEVIVTNYGEITTLGVMSHGIFAQSIGGGGGASSSLTQATDGETNIGIQLTPEDRIPGPDEVTGAGANGGNVTVHHNAGTIETYGAGAYGIFAQSVGGGGGFGGSMSSGDGYSLQIGVNGGFGGNGGNVDVRVAGDIHTNGYLAHGVLAQSVGGGGGVGSDASGQASVALGVGGQGGAGGNGGNVRVERTGRITTAQDDSIAIIAQSVGGSGGIGGTSFGRFTTDDNGGGPNELTLEMLAGSTGIGGTVEIIQTGEIETAGARSHGIVAQAVGGGGGIAGGQNTGAGSAGGSGNANAASAIANSQVTVNGAESYALFGQSATGLGNSNAVTLTAQSNLFAQGDHSVAAYGESTAAGDRGDITLNLNGQFTIGGGLTGVATMLVGGNDNVVNNHTLLYAMGHNFIYDYVGDAPTGPVPLNAILGSLIDDFSPMSMTGTGGNDRVFNVRTASTLGRIIGNIDLGGGINAFNNGVNASMVGLQSIDLGGGRFTNNGMMTNHGIGIVAPVRLTGSFTQTGSGDYVTDLDLNTQSNDYLELFGALTEGRFGGEAPLNFLSIDRLFGEYLLSSATDMQDQGLQPTTVYPTVGFNFLTRVDDGTDLILYAEKPTFVDLINDPASGVTDSGAVQMAQYLDGLEAVMSPADSPNELARLINMLRFLPDMETFGETLMRLTPHYAVHTLEMTSRATDLALESARDCSNQASAYAWDGNCVWASMSPESKYERDAGSGSSFKDDTLKQFTAGAYAAINDKWALGIGGAYTEFESRVTFKDELLSETWGENWQIHALAKYANGPYSADFAIGGGTGRFTGSRDTTVQQVAFIPGETLEGVYLPELLHEGIGNSVSYEQQVQQISLSGKLGYTFQNNGFYLKPNVQVDGRWIHVKGEEEGSVVAFNFDGPGNFFYSATPGIEIGTDLQINEKASLRLFAKGGIELSNFDWEIHGQFKAAEGLGAPPLKLTEEVDSPIYRVGAGAELVGANGIALGVRYNAAFGKKIEQQTVSGNLRYQF